MIKAILVISGGSREDVDKVIHAAEKVAKKTSKVRIKEFS